MVDASNYYFLHRDRHLVSQAKESPLGVRSVDFTTIFPSCYQYCIYVSSDMTSRRAFLLTLMVAEWAFFTPCMKCCNGRRTYRQESQHCCWPDDEYHRIGRIAQCGRNWDLVADPFFLAGVATHETILGMQSATS